MPFDWMHPQRAPRPGDPFRRQLEQAVAERARLFFGLGYSSAEATERIQAALRWEFDPEAGAASPPPLHAEVPGLVEAVYRRARGGRG